MVTVNMCVTHRDCPFCGDQLLEGIGSDNSIHFACSSCAYKVDIPDLDPRFATCATCGAPTKFRHGIRGVFIGCIRFPKCRFTWTVPGARIIPGSSMDARFPD
jgi:ssDNA-binding Zn-finger/Zn-ribbon topoisomerase 1